MTREEAKAWFKPLLKDEYAFNSADREAFAMAIKALEQEPCGDWYDVSSNEMTLEQARQAVKDLRKKLAEYLEQEPCEDTISRRAVIDLAKKGVLVSNGNFGSVCKAINELPSVNPLSKDYNTIYYTPQPKTGHWININEGKWNTIPSYKCSACGVNADLRDWSGESPFCPWCGAKMIEPQESEG